MAVNPVAPTADITQGTEARPLRLGLVTVLLLAGLAGHLLAARLIGSSIAYRDHVAGFVLIAVVTGILLLGLERLFWRGRRDVTLLSFGLVQALFGVVVFFLRPGVH
jgi:high-affinity Fe2+/Pb2+ permease